MKELRSCFVVCYPNKETLHREREKIRKIFRLLYLPLWVINIAEIPTQPSSLNDVCWSHTVIQSEFLAVQSRSSETVWKWLLFDKWFLMDCVSVTPLNSCCLTTKAEEIWKWERLYCKFWVFLNVSVNEKHMWRADTIWHKPGRSQTSQLP